MKRIALVMLVLAGFCVNAHAQFFAGGSVGLQYRYEDFSMKLIPQVGYEFNDTWAVGCGAGIGYDGKAYAIVKPYVRYSFWNNEKIFLDLKAVSDLAIHDGSVTSFVGLCPSGRFAINDNLQLSADIALLGVDIYSKTVKPAFGLSAPGFEFAVLYRF